MISYVQTRYLSPLMAELANDPRPPSFAAEVLLSDEPLPHPWSGTTNSFERERHQRSDAFYWLDAHDLLRRMTDGSYAWTRKGENYRARIRAAGIKSTLELWAWAKAGNAPSVWHHARNGRPWP